MTRTRMLLGFILAGIFLYLFLRNVDAGELWTDIKKGDPYWLLLSAFLASFNYFVRAVRWRFFLDPVKKSISVKNLTITTVIGFAVSTIFPAKIGEIVRPYLLASKENISKSAAMATIVVERVFDSASILLILVIYLVLLVRPDQLSAQAQSSLTELNRAGILLFVGILALVLFLYYLKTKPAVIRKWIRKIERILPSKIAHSIDDILDSFIHGLSILHDVRTLWKITYYSLFFWILICAGVWAGIRAYVPGFHFFGTFLIVPLLAIGIAVPTPGGIGSYHYACQLGLTRFFDVSESSASAIALVSHALTFIPITILGVILLWREGLNAVKIQKMTQSQRETAVTEVSVSKESTSE
jgi:uncharacterized protein (TIRG00374 family)